MTYGGQDGTGRQVDLTLTLVDPLGSAMPVDVVVSAPAGTPLSAVRADLLRTVGRQDGRLWCADRLLDVDAPLGTPPLVDGAILTVDCPDNREPLGLLELHVTAGPDCGAVHRLVPGEHGIGRSVGSRVRVDDPDVSRLHAVLRVGVEGADITTVHDLGSTNGTFLDDRRVTRDGLPVCPGQVMRVGATLLSLVVPETLPVSCRPNGRGHLELNRPPRHLTAPAALRVPLPVEPGARERARFPLVAAALPLVAGLALVALTRSPTYLLFVLLSPLMVIGSWLSDRAGGRRTGRAQQAEHAAALARASETLDRAVADEAAGRQQEHPDAATLLLTATGPRPRLWERRRDDPDALQLRLGLGTVPARVEVRTTGTAGRPEAIEHPPLHAVPVAVSLAEAGVVGLAGPRSRVLPLARFVTAQLAGWHSPRHLSLVVLCAEPGRDWEWTRWLPHVRPAGGQDATALVGADDAQVRTRVDELVALLDSRLAQASQQVTSPWHGASTVVVLDGAGALRRLPGVARLLAEGPRVGLRMLCCDRDIVSLPAECRATAEVVGEVGSGLRVVTDDGTTYDDVAADGVDDRWARRFARALAPLRDATPDDHADGLPPRARLLDLLGFDATDPAALETAWRVSPRGTRVPLGVGAGGGPFVVDLATDGPHMLVAGTTGSGKSELLQSLVAGLAVANRPDEMSFLLIDYKGGAAFKDCARLPHTVGAVTDLDNHLTERALRSLGAELRRRERVLRSVGCKDLDDYLAEAPPGAPALPRLLLVVDEFATLVEELPDFVGGLVGIAQRGRSLGVHLVLATQRPSGVVSADIRANTSLRIALRVTDQAESTDVVDSRDAARISRSTPGRAVARVAAGPVQALQTARVGGHAEGTTVSPTVRLMPWELLGDAVPTATVTAPEGPTDLARLVDAAAEAARRVGAEPAPSPWLPPLPATVVASDIDLVDGAVTIGVLDLPGEQRQAPLTFALDGGDHLLVVGGARSGRTTALRTLAGVLATRLDARDLHLYALDGGGGSLAVLADLPQCGAVVARDETARGERLLVRLVAELERRQQVLAASGRGSHEEQRQTAGPGGALPWVVLLADSWEGLQAAYDDVDHGRPLDLLSRLVREGAAVGIRVVLTGDRAALTSRVGAMFRDRIVLRLADPADYALAGIGPRQVPSHLPPGRALVGADTTEGQLGLLAGEPSGAGQVASLARIAEAARRRHSDQVSDGGPLRVEPLPSSVDVEAVETDAKAFATGPGWVLLGVGGDELDPVGVDLLAHGPALVVAGPPGSGRSTTLATVGRWLRHQGRPVAVVAHRRSPLHRLAGEPGVLACLGPTDAAQLAELLAAQRELTVLADDAETLHDTPVEHPLLGMLRPDAEGASLVLAGSASDMAGCFRGLTVEARRGRTGVLLGQVAPVDGDLLGVRLPRTPPGPVGRGVLVVRGRATPLQVARAAL